MHFNHTQRIASKCEHIIHPSAPANTPWCANCVTSTDQADLENVRKKLEAEGGLDPQTYMRDRAWNVARLRYIYTKRRVEKTRKRIQLRQEYEEAWEQTHQRYIAQYGLFPPESSLLSPCVVCAAQEELPQSDRIQVNPLTTAWWEQQGALVTDKAPEPKPSPSKPCKHRRSQARVTRPSSLRYYVQTFRAARDESESYNQAREDRCKTEGAVRRKYDLPDDFDIDPEFWTIPIPASHASYYHKQTQSSRHAGERRVNRQKRRAGTYKPSRSSLALSELADDIKVDDMEVERSRLAEEAEELQRQIDVVATEVGYLYFVGDAGHSEAVEYDVERSNRGLVYRRAEADVHMDHRGAEGEESGERQFSVWEDA